MAGKRFATDANAKQAFTSWLQTLHTNFFYVKGKAIPLQAWGGPEGSRRLRHMKVVRLLAIRTGRLYPRKYSWYLFLLEAESTTGPQCGRKDYVNEKFQ